MKAKYEKINKEQSAELGISEKAVEYIRPRLLGKSYNGDIKKLLASIVKHKQEGLVTIEGYKNGIARREKIIARNPKLVKVHKPKIEYTKESLENTEKKHGLYQEMIDFLNSDKANKIVIDLDRA